MAELIVKLKERELRRVSVVTAVVRVGRDVSNDVCIDNIGISRLHATIRLDHGCFVVKDESSSNGIFVNGDQVRVKQLEHGDEIQLGKFTLVFSEMGGTPIHELMSSPLHPDDANDLSKRNPVVTANIPNADLQKIIETHRKSPLETVKAPALAALEMRNERQPARDLDAPRPGTEGPSTLVIGLSVVIVALVGIIVVLLVSQ
jgi:pSer/pThr/pTyr-binding forkhead associated (FHA) protein